MPDYQSQVRLAHAVLEGKAKDSSMSKAVAQDFVSSMHGKKLSSLPDHAPGNGKKKGYKMGANRKR